MDDACVSEYKKARQEIKKAASDTVRLQKKVKKGKFSLDGIENRMIFYQTQKRI